VEKVVPLEGIGHCPHDEAPELVNPFLLEFLERVHGEDL
jgi:pimeloyl-ACP methyl ester carboxylesterase